MYIGLYIVITSICSFVIALQENKPDPPPSQETADETVKKEGEEEGSRDASTGRHTEPIQMDQGLEEKRDYHRDAQASPAKNNEADQPSLEPDSLTSKDPEKVPMTSSATEDREPQEGDTGEPNTDVQMETSPPQASTEQPVANGDPIEADVVKQSPKEGQETEEAVGKGEGGTPTTSELHAPPQERSDVPTTATTEKAKDLAEREDIQPSQGVSPPVDTSPVTKETANPEHDLEGRGKADPANGGSKAERRDESSSLEVNTGSKDVESQGLGVHSSSPAVHDQLDGDKKDTSSEEDVNESQQKGEDTPPLAGGEGTKDLPISKDEGTVESPTSASTAQPTGEEGQSSGGSAGRQDNLAEAKEEEESKSKKKEEVKELPESFFYDYISLASKPEAVELPADTMALQYPHYIALQCVCTYIAAQK